MPYKYQAQLDSLSLKTVLCPCQDATPREGLAYRFAHLPANSPSNFLPRPLEGAPPPRRINIPSEASDRQIIDAETTMCDVWAISLFETREAALRMFKKLSKFLTHTHVAELILTPTDGDCTPTDKNLHFNLHEAENACLGESVTKAIPIA